jgi:AcrR family transcriptional regulator/DNA-binding MarR family transcriptional regulator
MSVGRRRPGAQRLSSVPVRRGGGQVSELQRSRMLSSAVAIVSEYGYGRMSVARVTGRARVSRRTFYEFFDNREDCFLTVFDDAIGRLSGLVAGAYEREPGGWREKVRTGLAVLLVFLDEEPAVGSLLVVNALNAGPRVLERRAQVLQRLGGALDRGGLSSKAARGLPPLTGEGVVGAVFSVIHTRLLAKHPGSLVELLNPLMGMIVLPYQGPAIARGELGHPAPARKRAARERETCKDVGESSSSLSVVDPLVELPMRITYRTLRVLSAIGEHPGANNREIADHAGVSDQGQMSKLLARLERLGLAHNTAEGHLKGAPNRWRLTARGEEAEQSTRTRSGQASRHEISGMEGTRR